MISARSSAEPQTSKGKSIMTDSTIEKIERLKAESARRDKAAAAGERAKFNRLLNEPMPTTRERTGPVQKGT
jgi:hypothetical protein